jgi:lycopene cyclase CruA
LSSGWIPFGRLESLNGIYLGLNFKFDYDFGLFTKEEFESMITAEYVDGFNKFFDGGGIHQM